MQCQIMNLVRVRISPVSPVSVNSHMSEFVGAINVMFHISQGDFHADFQPDLCTHIKSYVVCALNSKILKAEHKRKTTKEKIKWFLCVKRTNYYRSVIDWTIEKPIIVDSVDTHTKKKNKKQMTDDSALAFRMIHATDKHQIFL